MKKQNRVVTKCLTEKNKLIRFSFLLTHDLTCCEYEKNDEYSCIWLNGQQYIITMSMYDLETLICNL